MSRATLVQNFGWNALAIIPNAQPEHSFSVADFGFNMARMRVLECIAQRLARDAVKLVPYDRVQVPGWDLPPANESRAVVGRKFVPHRVQRFGKLIRQCADDRKS